MNEKVSEIIIEHYNVVAPKVKVVRQYASRDYYPSRHSYKRLQSLIGVGCLCVDEIYISERGITITFWVNA